VNLRRAFLALGAATAVAGLLVVLQPSLAGGLSPTYVAVTAVGVLALVQSVGVAYGRLRGEREAAELDEVERVRPSPTPGGSFDGDLGRLPWAASRDADRTRAAVRERLRRVTVETLTRYEGYDREAAERALERGAWTDDPHATAFFAPETADPGLTDRIRDAVAADRAFVRRASAVASVLDAQVSEGRTIDGGRRRASRSGERANGTGGGR
jgi:hypothetical protein